MFGERPQSFVEQKRYPVSDCSSALTEVWLNLEGYTQETVVMSDKRLRHVFSLKDDDCYKFFLYAIEYALFKFTQISIPPKDMLKPCTTGPGCIHLYFLHIFNKENQAHFYCIRVFESLDPLTDPLTMFSIVSLPLRQIVDGSRISVYRIENCAQAADRLLSKARDYFAAHNTPATNLSGQFCYTTSMLNLEKHWNDLNTLIANEGPGEPFYSNYQPLG